MKSQIHLHLMQLNVGKERLIDKKEHLYDIFLFVFLYIFVLHFFHNCVLLYLVDFFFFVMNHFGSFLIFKHSAPI